MATTIVEPNSITFAEIKERTAKARQEFQDHLEKGGFRLRHLEGNLGDLAILDWYMSESNCEFFQFDEGASMSLLVSDILIANCGFTLRLGMHDSTPYEVVLVHRDTGCILFPWQWTWATYQRSCGNSPLAEAWIWRVIEQEVNSVSDASWHPVLDMAANESHAWPSDLQELAQRILLEPLLLLRLGAIALNWKPTDDLHEVKNRMDTALAGH